MAPEQHSHTKMEVFGPDFLNKAIAYQTKTLIDQVSVPLPSFTADNFMSIVSIVAAIDANSLSPKNARLQLLTMTSTINGLRQNVIEGIADMFVYIPLNPISDQGKFGKVDLQARFFCPLLTAIFADVTKNVILRWPSKMEETIPQIRPDAIISSLVQLNIGPSLGYGEVKPGDASTSKQSLCIDTMKLAVLSKNAASRNGHPIVSFQVNGFHLVFFVVQELDSL
ncbi:hypothetical protein BCR42DRAFT_397730 [Absidia repens]|uniref:Uncharacterized protein n=1 Tax=Absidia repens TaxID=90262 RepID=A0A1X2I098_9FUNG|nr:hypothetical protein BCR42DRAFT_397730 [Absidia repens]